MIKLKFTYEPSTSVRGHWSIINITHSFPQMLNHSYLYKSSSFEILNDKIDISEVWIKFVDSYRIFKELKRVDSWQFKI